MRNCTKMTVEEIRDILVQEHGYSRDDAEGIKGKQNLAYELHVADSRGSLNSLDEKPNFDEISIDSNAEVEAPVRTEVVREISRPTMGSLEWEGFVLSQLDKSEKEEKNGSVYPRACGLRRLAEKLLGPILKSGPTNVFLTGSDDSARAVVVYEVSIDFRDDNRLEPRVFSEAADCSQSNTPAPFSLHPVATASTRAEGRAFKKALQLTTVTAEEISAPISNPKASKRVTDEEDGDVPASNNQLGIINTWVKKLNLDRDKFVNFKVPGKTINTITRDDAIVLIDTIQKFSSIGEDNVPIPEEILLK